EQDRTTRIHPDKRRTQPKYPRQRRRSSDACRDRTPPPASALRLTRTPANPLDETSPSQAQSRIVRRVRLATGQGRLQILSALFLTRPRKPAKVPEVFTLAKNRLRMRFLSQADAGTRTPDPLLTMRELLGRPTAR